MTLTHRQLEEEKLFFSERNKTMTALVEEGQQDHGAEDEL